MVGSFIKDSSLINQTVDADYINLATSFRLDHIGKGGLKKYLAVFKVLMRTWKKIHATNYKLCYMTLTAKGAGFYKDFLVVLLLKAYGKKIIYHFHNKGVAEKSKEAHYDFLYRTTFKNTKSIVLSPLLYNDIKAYVPKEDSYVCANGIPDFQNLRKSHKKSKDQDGVFKFLFLSNMMEEKGVGEILSACKILKHRKLKFECHFIGAWSDFTEEMFFTRIKNFGINDNVFAHGKRYGDDKLTFFESADVFVFPTFYHNECFPLVLLEAMQHAMPVISTPEGGIPDLVDNGKTGLLVPQNNVGALANEMERLLNDRELCQRMGTAGRLRYEQLFSLPVFERNFSNILQDVVLEAAPENFKK